MNKVNTLDEAREWFTNNASGGVICTKKGEEKICVSFPEAEAFYHEVFLNMTTEHKSAAKSSQEDDSVAIGSGFMAGMGVGDILSTITAVESFSTPDPSPPSFDSGGGDFGGGGAGSEY